MRRRRGSGTAIQMPTRRARREPAGTPVKLARDHERGGEIYLKIASLMDRDASDPAVQEAVAHWRQHISDSFYECTLETFRGLGDLYVDDERFTANIDKIKPGLARFLREAIHAYCDSPESGRSP